MIAAANAGFGGGAGGGGDLFGGRGSAGGAGPPWRTPDFGGPGATTINVSVAGEGGGGLHRSEAQIAAALARAVALGFRR